MDTKEYELNFAQEIVKSQCDYTLFKRVINILTSVTFEKKIDDATMEKAFRKIVERNDCMRLTFFKKNKKWMQSFSESVDFDIPRLTFKTKEEQDAFVLKVRKNAIAYAKGKVFEVYFINTYDGKFMVFLKVCHMILDMYGLGIIFKDLCEVYDALEKGEELPVAPGKFEDVIIKDIIRKNDVELNKKNAEFFNTYFEQHEYPYYTGISGPDEPIWKKERAKGKHTMKMFFVHNDTEAYLRKLDKGIVEKAIEFCKASGQTLSKFFFFAVSVTLSKMNNDEKYLMPLQLCNCRGTVAEKKCAGNKVQSLSSYTVIDKEQPFDESLAFFSKDQDEVIRHIGYPDVEVQKLWRKIYGASLLSTFYPMSFSFVPVEKREGVKIDFYTNGKFALPSYVAYMWDPNTNEIEIVYDVQTKIIKEKDLDTYQNNYVNVLNQVLDNPKILIKDIKL